MLHKDEDDKVSDLEKAKQIAEKKLRTLRTLPKREQYQKLGAFLSRRGFDYETIRRAIDDILERGYNRD